MNKLKRFFRFFLFLHGKEGIKRGFKWTWIDKKQEGQLHANCAHRGDMSTAYSLGQFPCTECANWWPDKSRHPVAPGRSYWQPKADNA